MKKLFTALTLLMLAFSALAQPRPSEAQYTGNNNFLNNPSFEQGKAKWTLANGTWSTTTTAANVAHLQTAAEITLAGNVLDFTQLVDTPASLDGQSAKILMSVKTSIAGVEICGVVDSSEDSCQAVSSDGEFHEYIVKIDSLGGTNNGPKLKSSGSLTGTIFADDAILIHDVASEIDKWLPSKIYSENQLVLNPDNFKFYQAQSTFTATASFDAANWREPAKPSFNGNYFLLQNGDFEHETDIFGWTNVNGTASSQSTTTFEGNQAAQISLSAQALDISQTFNCDQYDGETVGFKGRFNSTEDLEVCFLQGSTEYNCQTVTGDDSWGHYGTHGTAKSGSTCGVKVKSASITDEVYIDAVEFIDDPFELINPTEPAQDYGELKYGASAGCAWSITGTTFTNYAADTDCATPTLSSNAKIEAPATKIPAVVIPSGSPAGTYEFDVKGDIIPNGDLCLYRISDGANNTAVVRMGDEGNNIRYPGYSGQVVLSNKLSADAEFNVQSREYDGTATDCQIVASSNEREFAISVKYYPPDAGDFLAIPAKSNQTDWEEYSLTIGGTTTAPTKGTIVRDKAQWKRVGDEMVLRYDFEQSTAGADGSGTYLFPLPSGYSIDTNKLETTTTAEIVVGVAMVNNSSSAIGSAIYAHVIPYNSTNLAVRVPTLNSGDMNVAGDLAGSARLETQLSNANQFYTYTAKVPIEGWDSSPEFLFGNPLDRVCYVSDVKTSGTAGGTSSSGNQFRTLNTINQDGSTTNDDCPFVTLSSNAMTVKADIFKFECLAPNNRGGGHRLQFYNNTDASIEVSGAGSFADGTDTQTHAFVSGRVEQSSFKEYKVQHYIGAGVATNGLGRAVTSGEPEVYTFCKIEKLK